MVSNDITHDLHGRPTPRFQRYSAFGVWLRTGIVGFGLTLAGLSVLVTGNTHLALAEVLAWIGAGIGLTALAWVRGTAVYAQLGAADDVHANGVEDAGKTTIPAVLRPALAPSNG